LQDVTEENAELALGVKANKGLIPPAAAATGQTPCKQILTHCVQQCPLALLDASRA
jgi:hypothetical protein